MCCCPGSRSGGCRCRLAARRTISAPIRCAMSAAGIPTTSPRMPTSACASRASAFAPPSSTSTTYEEAPARLGPWIRQRTRWFKGWMQTWGVHMREPVKLARELGFAGFVTFQLVVGGTVLAALVNPIFIALLGLFARDRSPVAGRGRSRRRDAGRAVGRRAGRGLSRLRHAGSDRPRASRDCCGMPGCCC